MNPGAIVIALGLPVLGIALESVRRWRCLRRAIFVAFMEQGRREHEIELARVANPRVQLYPYDHDVRMRAVEARVLRHLKDRRVPPPRNLQRQLVKIWARHYHQDKRNAGV